MSTRKFGRFGLVMMGAIGGVLVSLGISAVAQRGESLPLRELQQFANVFSAIKSSYVEPLTDQKLMNEAIKGLFSDLDPHSAYLDPEAFKEMEAITQGGFGGLGIEIGSEDGMPKVIAPIEDTPAARAGILSGDLITHIDGQPTKGMTLSEAIKLMRGEPKTPIVLTIQRAGQDKPMIVKIIRDMIKVRSVRSKMLPDDIGYVRIAQFQERTVADLAKQLRDMGGGKAPKGLVLDLRNDPGGLLDAAIGVSSAFLKPDVLVVSTKGRIPSSNREFHAKPINYVRSFGGVSANDIAFPEWAKTVPMVVLINVGSASASEIVAGALQDYKRAKVLGNRSFGKGSVQSVLPLTEDSGIKLTTALYYTPSGRSIQATGVEPDIVVDDTPLGNLFRIPREADLQHHLANGSSAPNVVTPKQEDETMAPPDAKMFEFGGADDFQLKQAINVLQGRTVKKNEVAAKASDAEKKNDAETVTGLPSAPRATDGVSVEGEGVERYRVTPEGMIKVR